MLSINQSGSRKQISQHEWENVTLIVDLAIGIKNVCHIILLKYSITLVCASCLNSLWGAAGSLSGRHHVKDWHRINHWHHISGTDTTGKWELYFFTFSLPLFWLLAFTIMFDSFEIRQNVMDSLCIIVNFNWRFSSVKISQLDEI